MIDEVGPRQHQDGQSHPVARAVASVGLHGHLIHRLEQSAARFGVDIRLPFLDPDLVAFLCSLPPYFISPGGQVKGLLRNAMNEVLPPAVSRRQTRTVFDDLFKGEDSLWSGKHDVKVWTLVTAGLLDPSGLRELTARAAVDTAARNTMIILSAAEAFSQTVS